MKNLSDADKFVFEKYATNTTPSSSEVKAFLTATWNACEVFDRSRFIWDNLEPVGISIIPVSSGAFGEEEELFLVQTIYYATGFEILSLTFEKGDRKQFVTFLAVLLLVQYDFWIISSALDLVIEHSHDNGLNVVKAPDSFIEACVQVFNK